MKKVYLTIIIGLLSSVTTFSQLYYDFSAGTSTYTPLVGGTKAALSPAYPGTYDSLDEGIVNNVPIGFIFNYNGTDYSTINLNTNGFATLGEPLRSLDFADVEYYVNNLSGGPAQWPFTRPVIAPLWDDHALPTGDDLTYTTTGIAPGRIFTVQWSNIIWRNGTQATSAISFQLVFHEGSNIIEFNYRQEGGNVNVPSASIGITTSETGSGSFISLENTSATPSVSSVTETKTINEKPATNQQYRFTPQACSPPNGLRTSGYSNSSVTFKWSPVFNASMYEHAVTTSSTPPTTGSFTSNVAATVSNLIPATLYYMHVRTSCGTNWRTESFTTADAPLSLPYSEDFETAPEPGLPSNFRMENFSNTSMGEAQWNSLDYPGYTTSGTKALYISAYFVNADNWFFTPGLTVAGGTSYTLRFKYATIGGTHSLQVKYGTKTGADSMSSSALFSKSDINNNLDDGEAYQDTSIILSPASDGIYYFGFQYNSMPLNASAGFLLLDDISLDENTALPVELTALYGEARGAVNALNWKTTTEQNNAGFEVQRSIDGNNFSKTGFVETKAVGGNSNATLIYNFNDIGYSANTNYYRLKQIDKDGRSKLSNTVVIKNNKFSRDITAVYPSPAKDVLNVKIASFGNRAVTLLITDVNGKSLLTKATNVSDGESNIQLNVARLRAGTYFLKVLTVNGQNSTRKFVKL